MEKRIACNDVVPGCTFTAEAATEEELLQKVQTHAAHAHGVTDMTPELAEEGEGLYLDADPVHLNVRGNELTAEKLLKTILPIVR